MHTSDQLILERGNLFLCCQICSLLEAHNRAIDVLVSGDTAGSAGSHGWQFTWEGSSGQRQGVWPSSIVFPLSANDIFLFQGVMNQSVTTAVYSPFFLPSVFPLPLLPQTTARRPKVSFVLLIFCVCVIDRKRERTKIIYPLWIFFYSDRIF